MVEKTLALDVWQVSTKDKEEELRRMQEKHGVDGEQHARKPSAQS